MPNVGDIEYKYGRVYVWVQPNAAEGPGTWRVSNPDEIAGPGGWWRWRQVPQLLMTLTV